MKHWQSFKYKHLFFLLLSIIVSIILYKNHTLNALMLNLENLGYVGVFITGILFVSAFTVITSIVIIAGLASKLSPLEIGVIGGLGAVVGDLTIFRFIRNDLIEEITPIYKRLGGNHITRIANKKYCRWLLPIIGAIIIASPFPDEIGVGLMGLSKMKTYQFIIISFILNTIGIYLIASTYLLFKH